MSGHDLVVGADDADQRAVLLLVRQAQGVEEAPVGGILNAVDDIFLTHSDPSDQLLMSLSSSLQL